MLYYKKSYLSLALIRNWRWNLKESIKHFCCRLKRPKKSWTVGNCEKAFDSISLVKSWRKEFSVVTNLLMEKRSRLNITEQGDMRLFLTKLNSNIDYLLSFHQVHPSHQHLAIFWNLLYVINEECAVSICQNINWMDTIFWLVNITFWQPLPVQSVY